MQTEHPDGWQRLTCTCGTERFARTLHLRYRRGAGMTEEPSGYFCLECQATVDSAALIAKAEVRAKQRELTELQQELSALPQKAAATVGKGK